MKSRWLSIRENDPRKHSITREKFIVIIYSEINSDLITRNDLALIETLVLGDNSFSQYDKSRISEAALAFIVTSKRFDDSLLVWSTWEELGSRH